MVEALKPVHLGSDLSTTTYYLASDLSSLVISDKMKIMIVSA